MSAGSDDAPPFPGPAETPELAQAWMEFEVLYRKHVDPVLRAATFASLGSRSDGWDATHHAFEQAWQRMISPKGKAVENWEGWLRRSAVRYVLRSRPAREVVSLEGIDRPASDAPVDAQVISKESWRKVIALLGQLSARRREAVVLRFIAGYSTAETARIMGVESGTVRSLVEQARAVILKGMGQEGDDG
ncbi:RNA polymerase sigma factor [Streptomyces sp. NPDC020817]|uniref:RNA polymerase sigma factor n=1 Tax=Streptomyces sp. NPDC020817 TaxID=3365095 RepID=UPI0037929F7D